MAGPQYEVLSLLVGSDPHRTVGTNFFYDSFPAAADLEMPQDYLFWIIRGEGRCLVVDTGFPSAAAFRRGRRLHRLVEEHLTDLGIDPSNVTDLVMTHLHWDHAGNIGLFPRARLHLQEAELAYCTGPAMLQRGVSKVYSLQDVQSVLVPLFEGRVNLIDGEVELFPGVFAVKVGGHTPGSMALQVATERGPIVLASDAAHFWANFQRRSPFPILDSFSHALRGFEIIDRLAGGMLDRVVPGHDPLLRSLFPPLRGHDGVTCLHAAPLGSVEAAIDAYFSQIKAA